jgi:hypothetical protein
MTPTTKLAMTDLDDSLVVANQNGEGDLPMVFNSQEVDIQISTALRYPRSIKAFKERAIEMATLDEATAASCIYTLPRAGKPITGPSVRLAEICASAWKNLRVESRVAGETDREIIAEATCWDLENNIAIRIQNRRRITYKNGGKFDADLITVTGNAAISIALRNAIFRVIPKAYVNDIFLAARQTAIGEASTLTAVRANVVEYFGKMGVTPDRILTVLEKPSLDDVGLDDIAVLKGYATAIKDGQTTVDEAFPLMTVAEARAKTEQGGMAGLKERMQAAPKPEEEPQPEEAPVQPATIPTEPEAETEKPDDFKLTDKEPKTKK